MSDIGHNSNVESAEQLRLFVERIERLLEERQGINDDIKDIYGEAKATGYDPKMMRFVIAKRKMDKEALESERAEQETYLSALGLL